MVASLAIIGSSHTLTTSIPSRVRRSSKSVGRPVRSSKSGITIAAPVASAAARAKITPGLGVPGSPFFCCTVVHRSLSAAMTNFAVANCFWSRCVTGRSPSLLNATTTTFLVAWAMVQPVAHPSHTKIRLFLTSSHLSAPIRVAAPKLGACFHASFLPSWWMRWREMRSPSFRIGTSRRPSGHTVVSDSRVFVETRRSSKSWSIPLLTRYGCELGSRDASPHTFLISSRARFSAWARTFLRSLS